VPYGEITLQRNALQLVPMRHAQRRQKLHRHLRLIELGDLASRSLQVAGIDPLESGQVHHEPARLTSPHHRLTQGHALARARPTV
jgi:hypothetical protein